MQGKLNLPKGSEKRARSAAYLSGVQIVDAYELGGELTVEFTSKSAEKIFKFGQHFATCDGSEMEALEKRKAERLAAKAAPGATKPALGKAGK